MNEDIKILCEAAQALQNVRTTLAYQLTPEAVDRLLEPIQKALAPESFLQHVELTGPFVAAHNAKVEDALLALQDRDFCPDEIMEFIRSLRL